MFKKLIFISILFLVFAVKVNANTNYSNIYNIVKPGDIIIGSTRFSSNIWISSNRAGKAGILHYQLTSDDSIDTYLFVADLGLKKIWYKYNNDIDDYELLSESSVMNLDNNIIYYDDNIPISY